MDDAHQLQHLNECKNELERLRHENAMLRRDNDVLQVQLTNTIPLKNNIAALSAELEYRTTQLLVVNEIARDVSLLTNLSTTLRRVLEKLRNILPLDVFYVALLDPEGLVVNFPIMFDVGRFWEQEPVPIMNDGWVSQVVRGNKALIINRTAEELATGEKPARMLGDEKRRSASIIIAPLTLGGDNIGAISVQSYTINAYTEKDTDLLLSTALQIAIAIENSRLYDSLQSELALKEQAEHSLRELNTELEQRVQQRTVELALLNQELEAFASSISHDLRAPLHTIDGFSRMLFETYDAELDETAKHYLSRIRHATQRMEDMIDGLLTLSRVTRYELRPQRVNLSEMVHTIMQSLVELTPEREYELIVQEDVYAFGDSRLLRTLLENLLNNAWKYSIYADKALIEFGLNVQNGKDVYFIRDNGAGFDANYAHKLFSVFQRLHNNDEFAGTGVGLATVKRIVMRHSGHIWATSEINQGATFFFTLLKP